MSADSPDSEPIPAPPVSHQSPAPAPPVLRHSPASAPPASRRRQAYVPPVLTMVVTALLGVPLGLLWQALAPRAVVLRVAQGPDWPGWPDGWVPAQPEPEQFIGAYGWFSLLGLGFGVLTAIAVWLILRSQRGPAGLLVVAFGTLAAAVISWWWGRASGLADFARLRDSVPVGQAFHMPPLLRALGDTGNARLLPDPPGLLLVPAFGAVVAYVLLAGWSRYASLRPDPQPSVPGSGSAVPGSGSAGPGSSSAGPGSGPAGLSSGSAEAPEDPSTASAPPAPDEAGPFPG